MACSSSECEDLLNPDACIRPLVDLYIEHRDGTVESIPSGYVVVSPGANIDLLTDSSNTGITIKATPSDGSEDPYYVEKYNALANIQYGETSSGEAVDTERPAWVFSDSSIYLSTINGVHADQNAGSVFITGDGCTSIEPPIVDSLVDKNYVKVRDICPPCVDCLHYYKIEEYLSRIESFYDYVFNLSYSTDTTSIPNHPDGGVRESFTGVMQQLAASRKYWNNLVHRASVRLSATTSGQSISVSGYYKNNSDRSIGDGVDGVTFTFLMSFIIIDPIGVEGDWDGISENLTDVVAIDRQKRVSADLGGTELTFPSTHEIQVQMITGADIISGSDTFADFSVILRDTSLKFVDGYNYRVDIVMTVENTHLGPVVNDNPISRQTSAFFKPPVSDEGASSGDDCY